MPNRELVAVTTAAAVAMLMMVLMVVTASTVVFVIVVTSAVASTTTVAAIAAATSGEVLHHVVYLFLSGVAVLQNGTFEVECFTSQRMVEVNLYLLFCERTGTRRGGDRFEGRPGVYHRAPCDYAYCSS